MAVPQISISFAGHVLAGPAAVAAIKSLLIPGATVLTPNMPEAGALLGRPPPTSVEEVRALSIYNDIRIYPHIIVCCFVCARARVCVCVCVKLAQACSWVCSTLHVPSATSIGSHTFHVMHSL